MVTIYFIDMFLRGYIKVGTENLMLSLGRVDFKSPKKNKTWRPANLLFYHK